MPNATAAKVVSTGGGRAFLPHRWHGQDECEVVRVSDVKEDGLVLTTEMQIKVPVFAVG